MPFRGILHRRALLAMPAVLAALPAGAQGRFPNRPIRCIIPYPPGGVSDSQMRALCDAASRRFGQPVVPENRAGGGGIMGAQVLAGGTRPDGYTVAQMPVTVFRHPHIVPRPAFDPLTDFTWIIQVTGYLFGVVVRADSPWRTLEEAIAWARTDPGGFTYATSGVGSSMHITMQDIAAQRGVEFTHVPFRGTAESLSALLGGQIAAVGTSSEWGRLVEEGKLRLLFTTGAQRARRFPDAPTLQELGFGLVVSSPYGIAGPKDMDPAVVKTLHDGFKDALSDPAYRAVIDRLDMGVEYLDSAAYAEAARRAVGHEGEVVRRFNLRQG